MKTIMFSESDARSNSLVEITKNEFGILIRLHTVLLFCFIEDGIVEINICDQDESFVLEALRTCKIYTL